MKGNIEKIDNRFEGISSLDSFGVADPGQADSESERDQHELREVVFGEGFADARRNEFDDQIDDRFARGLSDRMRRIDQLGALAGLDRIAKS